MNKSIIITYCTILCFTVLLPCTILLGQKSDLNFNNIRLDKVIKSLEDNSGYIFNYDPDLIGDYHFTGNLNTEQAQKCISEILYNTPFEFIIDKSAVLIFKPEPSIYRICGTLTDSNSKELLIGCNIYANGTTKGGLSNEQGYFEFSLEAFKDQKISISYIGYKTLHFQVQEVNQQDCEVFQMIQDESLFGEGIVITDFILDGISEKIDFNGFNLDYGRLSKQHSMIEHDLLKTAQLLPGISSVDESATNLQIRGGTTDQNLILWEGIPIYQPGHIFGMISAINPFSVRNVQIHQGVHDPKYDSRVGGIIDISLSDSIETKGHGSAGITLTEAHVNVETPVLSKKMHLSLSGRHSINDLYYSPPLENYTNKVFQFTKIDDNSSGEEEGLNDVNQGLKFYDWNGKLLFKPVESLLINVGYYTNNQRFEYNLRFPFDPFNTSDLLNASTEAFKSKIDWKINKKWTSSLSFVNAQYESEYTYEAEELGDILTDYAQFNDIKDQSLTLNNTYKLPFFELNTGYDFNTKIVSFSVINDNINEPLYDDNNFSEGNFHNFFASANFNRKKLHISGGIRSTYYMEQKRWFQSPRISLQYLVNDKFKIKTEAGIFHQFVSQTKEYEGNSIQVESPLWVLNAGEGIPSQKANKLSTGMNYHSNGWLFDVEAFYNQTTGLTTLTPIFELIPTLEFSTGKADAFGLAMIIKKKWKNIDTWINYSYSKINYSFSNLFQSSFPAPNEIRHNVNFVGSYSYRDLQFSLVGNYRTGLPFSMPSGVLPVYDDDVENETYYILEYQSINEERLKAYSRLDFSINYRPKFNLVGNSKMELSLSILNVLNSENVFAREYYLESKNENEAPEPTFIRKSLLGRTPLVLFRVYW